MARVNSFFYRPKTQKIGSRFTRAQSINRAHILENFYVRITFSHTIICMYILIATIRAFMRDKETKQIPRPICTG